MTREQKRSLLLIAAATVLLIGLHFVPVTGWLKLVLYLIPYLLVGGETLVDACKGIYNRQPFDENLLMAVATIGAMVLGDYPEAVSVMLFYQIGELFESYAVGRSRRNIGDLMDIRPDYANVETADGVARVKPEQVAVGDTIVVKPGERVPLDGTVLTGTSALNMSALTGESAPVDVTEGSTVVSGSVNLSGVLRLRVEKVYAESTVARILELVENSSLKKAHTERFITKFARVYTPSVCGAALALAILPPVVRLIMGIPAEWGDWIYRALTFLVISCPCALVISIPLSFFGGIGDTVNHVHGTARQVEQHHADAPVTAQLERTRGKVGSKPERLHGRMNLIACRLSHAIGLVDHARHRLERNARGNCHIVH